MAGRESINQPERIAQLRAIVERTRAELEAFVGESRGEWRGGPQADGPSEGPDTSAEQGQSGPIEQL